MSSPAPRAGFIMIRLIWLIGLIWVMTLTGTNQSFAFDRNAMVTGAKSVANSNYTYNVVTNIVSAGPVQVGSTNRSLPAYGQIAQTVAQIQALKAKLKNFSPK